MTSEAGVERVVEEKFFFHCSCGASFETSCTQVACGDCGETVEVVRCVPTATGKKYKLRISKQRRGWNRESGLWSPAISTPLPVHRPHLALDQRLFRDRDTTHRARYSGVLDHNERCLRLGLLILLAPLWVPLLLLGLSAFLAPAPVESREGTIVEPKPIDCGLFSGCRYEQRTRVEKGYTIVTWERVSN